VVALLAKERKGPDVKAQVLFYPVTDASMSTDSYKEFAEGPWLTQKGMKWLWDQYLPDLSKRRHSCLTDQRQFGAAPGLAASDMTKPKSIRL
jgi:acetyl esterase/lipase